MKVVLQTPSQLVVHEGILKTVVVATIFLAVGGGLITLRLTSPSGWSGNAGPWLIYLVGGVVGYRRPLALLSRGRRVRGGGARGAHAVRRSPLRVRSLGGHRPDRRAA